MVSSPTYDYPKPSAASTSKELSHQCWYHGKIKRITAEALMKHQGDFLVRDSISKVGDYVLTSMWNGKALHFQINRAPSSLQSKSMYMFEEEQFGSVVDLVEFYQSHKKAITLLSGAQIESPVVTTNPTNNLDNNLNVVNLRPAYSFSSLSLCPGELEANYAHVLRPELQKPTPSFERSLSQQVVLNQAKKQLQKKNMFTSENNLAPKIPMNGRITGSVAHLPLSSLLNRPLPEPERSPTILEQEDYCEMDYDEMEDTVPVMISSSHSTPSRCPSNRSSFIQEDDLFPTNPRISQRCDSSFSLSSIVSESAATFTNLSPFNKTYSCHNLATNRSPGHRFRLSARTDSAPSLPQRLECVEEDFHQNIRDSACVPDHQDYDVPLYSSPRVSNATSLVDAKAFRSLYLNKATQQPLAEQVVETVKALLHSTDPESLAMMICHEDCRILRLIEPIQGSRTGDNGLVLIVLPHGNVIRNDLIERSRCLQFTCLLSILKCKSSQEQAKLLAAYIQVAKCLVYELGNAFSFVNIMSTLCSKQMESLETMWSLLDNSALHSFESYLVPALKYITKTGKLPSSAKSCVIPFVQPVLELMAKNFSGQDPLFFDNSTFSTEIDSLWKWLEISREWSNKANVYREAAKKRYGRATSRTDNIFATEFMMRFLFGNQASTIDAPVRYSKMRRLAEMLTRQAVQVI
ncbi:hypothetical protein L596_021078 [Steinernema carpocapsae]|uniref:SH2 domain-containing protein n=1 Tax=Steinernema carpocapsae TaxID=34508 RepID=A0A4U5MVH0_STECR|nr:hypothetical protein L596_021078 [Steinernema carpocapsae]